MYFKTGECYGCRSSRALVELIGLREYSRGLFYFEEHDEAKGKKQEKAPKSCEECEHWAEVKNKLRVGRCS